GMQESPAPSATAHANRRAMFSLPFQLRGLFTQRQGAASKRPAAVFKMSRFVERGTALGDPLSDPADHCVDIGWWLTECGHSAAVVAEPRGWCFGALNDWRPLESVTEPFGEFAHRERFAAGDVKNQRWRRGQR